MGLAVMLLLPVPVLFLGAKGAVMFDLSKLNESIKAGTDRIGRILGKDTLEKVKENAWKAVAKENANENPRDRKGQLRETER